MSAEGERETLEELEEFRENESIQTETRLDIIRNANLSSVESKKEWTQTFSRRMESVQHKKVDWAGAAANDVRKAQHSLGEDALADTLNASKFKLEVLKTRICAQSTPSM